MRHTHSFKMITPEELHARLHAGEDIHIIDTLPAEHFREAHLPKARNACVYDITFIDQVHAICYDSSCPIVVYGAGSTSLDSRTAAAKLAMAGYSDITVLDGGIERWRQSGYALAGDAPDSGGQPDSRRLIADGEYRVIVSESTVDWTGRNANGYHFGTVNIASGSLHIDNSAIQGWLIIDMESINNTNLAGDELHSVLVSHLKSDDFFFIDAFPSARFTITGGRFNNEPYPTQSNCEMTGTLDLRGIQNELTLEATVAKGMDGHLHLSAHFDLDRTLWGITYGSSKFYEHLGKHAVFDHITIELLLVAEKMK